jgi:hypothetical protein
MSGWRDTKGHTRAERRALEQAGERARLLETAKKRPLSLMRAAALIAFALVVAAALVLQFR